MARAYSLPKFGDFDDGKVYETCYRAALRGDTSNFVIEFDSTKAYAAHDLDDASIKQLLQLEVNGFALSHSLNKDDVEYRHCLPKIEC